MIINRIYETQNLLSLKHVSFLVELRTYQHPGIIQNAHPTNGFVDSTSGLCFKANAL